MPKYYGSIKLVSGITQANGKDFPLVNAPAVQVDDEGKRLDTKLEELEQSINDAKSESSEALASLQEELEQSISTAKSEAIADAASKDDVLKSTLEEGIATAKSEAISDAASKDDVLKSILENSIDNAKSEAIADAANKDSTLKATLEESISTAKSEAISDAASKDSTLKTALEESISTAKSEAIADAASKDSTLKATLENAIDNAKSDAKSYSDGLNNAINEDIRDIITRLENLEYKPIVINSFTVSPTVAEMGSTINDITLKWALSKTPKTVKLNEENQDDKSVSVTKNLSNANVNANNTYKLAVTDERDYSTNKTASINFYNGVYTGSSIESEINNDFFTRLTKKLQSNRAMTINTTANSNEYIWYCCPTSYGTPKFTTGGFTGGFTKVKTLDYTNQYGYTISYDVWRSDYDGLGSQTVKVV